MKTALLFALCLTFSWPLLSDQTAISSDTISFDGDLVLLSGHVKLQHALGELTAKTARLKKELKIESALFSKVILKDDVEIALKNKSHIYCDLARLDFNTLLGDLTSFTGAVKYQGDFAKLGKATLYANAINFKMVQGEGFEIDHLMANGSVKANIEDRYKLSADKMTYHRMNPLSLVIKKNVPEGIIRAYRNCHFEAENFDLTAGSILFDMRSYLVQTIDAKGHIIEGEDLISFIANRASYDIDKENIWLEEGAIITSERLGLLQAENKMQIVKGKKGSIDHLFIQGPMKYTYLDHTLISNGALTVNQKAGILTAERKKAPSQVFYENAAFSVYSNSVKMLYNGNRVEKVEGAGDVLILLKDKKELLQTALCDRAYYFPGQNRVHLIAEPGKRVYLCGEDEPSELIAEEIIIEANEKGEKTVQCIGQSTYKTVKK